MPSFAPLRPILAHPLVARPFSSTTAAQLARVSLIGRLGAAPEGATTQSGKEIVRYPLGTSNGVGENRVTSWWNIAYFGEGDRRNYLLNLPKGSLVFVECEARMRKVERENGTVDNVMSLAQNRIELLKRHQPSAESADEPAPSASEDS